MTAESRLNQIVKDAPTANVRPPPTAPLPALGKSSQSEKYSPDSALAALPSSPPQIYLNLLILESSLRAQYLHLVARRRLNSFFLLLLASWNALFFYALFLRPREDGTGLGGSVYWVVETSEKLALMGGVVTVLLVWGTGQFERGIRWPRKWLGTTNRGLRGFNLRVVVIRGKFWREILGHLSFLLPYGLWREAGGSDWHVVEHEDGTVAEEDLAKGGDSVMLLLLPKSFSPEFRENWEEYRTEYWEKENERRAGLRKKLTHQRRLRAKEAGGWKWWTGAWKLAPNRPTRRHHDLEKHPHGHHHSNGRQGSVSTLAGALALGAGRRRTGLDSDSTQSRSRQSSRSSTPHLDLDGSADTGRPVSERVRRGSSVSSTASVRRKPRSAVDRKDSGLSPLTSSSNAAAEDEREERRRRRREREAAREREKKTKDNREDNDASASSVPTTPKSEAFEIKSEPGLASLESIPA
ncbi:Spo7-like protein-domain-containing protein [Exophiala viscosa]|uniref:Spo7-like protein-domain-containing protein n=1 Tax=Exophiala viscosa TaxID=2486360 RepID=UPI002195B2C6|nr:Spo7-like protein-domain-containing protein [Exophiala viscosa]